ncbi:MAG: hypothetical protein NC248_09730 [Bacteroides sp.]|nr:hypothetical protein [Bacteroides sp.]MCM1390451.1 hypothetical protein [Bacteroides sp.]
MKVLNTFFIPMLLMSAASCDDGKIYEDVPDAPASGMTVKVSGSISGIDSWTGDYSICVAGFGDSDFALISKPLTEIDSDGNINIEMSGLTENVTAIEICALNRLRKRVVSFASIKPDYNADDIINFNFSPIDAGMYTTIQGFFNASCVQCHGGSNHAAAGLNLTAAESYLQLVGIPSVKSPDMERITPGNASESILWQTVAGDVSAEWAYNHRDLLSSTGADVMKSWIDGGARR